MPNPSQKYEQIPVLGRTTGMSIMQQHLRLFFLEWKLFARILEERELKCPNCGKTWIAEIFWGYPGDIDSIEEELSKKEIVLGGCLITDNDPRWECNNCHHRWGYAEHNDEKIDSFDFDKGFNIEEVYDQ